VVINTYPYRNLTILFIDIKKRIFRYYIWEKKSKVTAMLLVVGTVVFVASCAEKTNNAENENQAASGQNFCSNKRKYDWKHYSSNWNSYK
jgi:hypothetical protein